MQTTFTLSRQPDSPSETYLTGQFADYKVLLPPDTAIYIEVSADGYKTRYFVGGAITSGRSPLRLGPGETLHLNIALEPDPSTASSKPK